MNAYIADAKVASFEQGFIGHYNEYLISDIVTYYNENSAVVPASSHIALQIDIPEKSGYKPLSITSFYIHGGEAICLQICTINTNTELLVRLKNLSSSDVPIPIMSFGILYVRL